MKHIREGGGDGHSCTNDPGEKDKIIKEIRKLMSRLEETPCIPRPHYSPDLSFLDRKQPRFLTDPDDVPTITHVPLMEIRPTADYRKIMKANKEWHNVVFIDVPPPQSTHASPPWDIPRPESCKEYRLPCPRKHCVCCPHH